MSSTRFPGSLNPPSNAALDNERGARPLSAPMTSLDCEESTLFDSSPQYFAAELPPLPPRSRVVLHPPMYEGHMSKTVLLPYLEQFSDDIDALDDFINEAQHKRNWPDWMMVSLRSTLQRDPASVLNRIRTVKHIQERSRQAAYVEADARRVFVKAVTYRHKVGVKHVSNVWRPPIPRSARKSVKPSVGNFSPKSFRRWADYIIFTLSQNVTAKTSFVTGNLAAQALFYCGSYAGSIDTLKDMLTKASFFIDDYNYVGKPWYKLALSQWVKTSYFAVGSLRIVDINQVFEHKEVFSKHKPLFRAMINCFCGTPGFTFDETQRLLTKFFPPPPEYVPPPKVPILDEPGLAAPPKWPTYPRVPLTRQTAIPTSKGVVTHQGNSVSSGEAQPTFRVSHSVDFKTNTRDHVDALSAISELVDEVGGDLSAKYKRPVLQVVALLAALAASTSWQTATTALMQFAVGNDFVWKHCSQYVSRLPSQVVTRQGFLSDTCDAVSVVLGELFAPLWDAITACCSISLIKSMFSDAASYIIEPLKFQLTQLRLAVLKTGTKTVAESVVVAITSILRRVKNCITARSWAPLWGRDWDPRVWLDEVEGLITYYPVLTTNVDSDPAGVEQVDELRAKGIIPSFWTAPVTVGVYLEICESRLEAGRDMMEYFASSQLIVTSIRAACVRLRAFIEITIGSNTTMALRQAPLMVYYFGNAGVGKTNLAKQIAKAVGTTFGYDTTTAGTYTWDIKSNFQTGLDHKSWHIFLDDIDQGVAPDTAGVMNNIETVIKLHNNAPFPVEQAAVELKGRIRANPVLLSYCSNYFDGKVQKRVADPNAFWRRVDVHVTVRPKTEYAIGAALDKAKASLSGTHDLFELDVREYDATLWTPENRACKPLKYIATMSVPEFSIYIRQKYEAHRARENARLREQALVSPTCPLCGLDNTRACGCKLVHQGCRERFAFVQDFSEALWQVIGQYQHSIQATVDSWRQLPTSLQFGNLRSAISFGLTSMFTKVYWGGFANGVMACGLTIAVLAASKKLFLQGREANASGLTPPTWLRADQTFTPGVPTQVFHATHTYDDLISQVTRSWVYVVGPVWRFNAFLLSHNTIILPEHIGKLGETISITHNGNTISMQLTTFNFQHLPHQEICVIKCSSLRGSSGIASKFWKNRDESIVNFDKVELWTTEKLYETTKGRLIQMPQGITLETNMPTRDGDCGAVYVANFGKAWWIVGVHYGILTNALQQTTALGGIVTQLQLDRVTSLMATTLQGAQTCKTTFSKDPTQITFSRYPAKSEVWAAQSHHGAQFYPEGTLDPPLSGSTLKTKIVPSLIAEDFADLAELWTGQPNYWTLPDFRGKMCEDKWVSPFTSAFKTQNWKSPNEKVMWLALADYLKGMSDLDNDGYGELSEDQAITGVPGSYIRSANLRTSVGPPFNRPKFNHIAKTDEGVFMDGDVWVRYDELDGIIQSGAIPVCVGLCTLKDEPVKPGKMPRVFTNLPFTSNMAFKQSWSPIKSFVRANFEFFESAVGINMTSAECNKIPQALRAVNPELDKIQTRDVKALDKSWSGVVFDFVGLIFFAIAWYLGTRTWRALSLVWSVKYTRFSIKNDIFCIFWNPSGHDATVEFNGFAMSLSDRFVYYFSRQSLFSDEEVASYMSSFFSAPLTCSFSDRLDYRTHNVLIHYGDDSVKASHFPVDPDESKIWQDELGMTVTDASKDREMGVRPLTDSSFLKRTFKWDEELGLFLPPLALSSMARTLMMKKESTLTMHDHAAVAMSEVMREAVYHGRELFEMLRARCDAAAIKYGIENSPLYVSHTYDYWRVKVAENNFQTWSDKVSPSTNTNTPPPPENVFN